MKVRSRLARVTSLVAVTIAAAAILSLSLTDRASGGVQPSVGLYYTLASDPQVGAGQAAPLWQLLIRTDSPSIYYKSGTANTAWTKLGSGASGGGTVTSIDCLTGLQCTPDPIVASGTIGINLTTTTCAAGQAEITTAADGTSTCATFFNTAGVGLGSTGSSVNLNITPTTCSAGSALTATASDGTGTCTPFVPAAGVSGTTNTIAKFTSTTAVGNSSATDDGSTFAISIPTSTVGFTNTAAEIQSSTISPTALVGPATFNDYAPTGFATARTIRQDANTGTVTLTGLAGGVAGRRIVLINISTEIIQLTDEDSGSTPANRFRLMSVSTYQLAPRGSVTLEYDGTSARWRTPAIASATSTISSIAGALSVSGVITGKANLTASNSFTGSITPSAISGSTNDYNPTDIGSCTTVRQDVSSAATLTGIDSTTVAVSQSGRILSLQNIATAAANTITLVNESTSSSPANRFTLPNGANYVIPPGGAVLLRYSGTTSRWTIWSGASAQNSFSSQSSSSTGSVNNFALNAGTTLLRFTAATVTLTGIAGGVDGRCIDLENGTGASLTVSNLSASSSAGNRLLNLTGAQNTIVSEGGARYCYDSSLNTGAGAWAITAISTTTLPVVTSTGTMVGQGTVNFTGASSNVSLTGTGTHLRDTGTGPTLSSCGTSPTVTTGAGMFTITTGGTATGCVATFSRTYTTAPTCVVTSQSGVQPTYTVSATALTLSTGTAASTIYNAICIGH